MLVCWLSRTSQVQRAIDEAAAAKEAAKLAKAEAKKAKKKGKAAPPAPAPEPEPEPEVVLPKVLFSVEVYLDGEGKLDLPRLAVTLLLLCCVCMCVLLVCLLASFAGFSASRWVAAAALAELCMATVHLPGAYASIEYTENTENPATAAAAFVARHGLPPEQLDSTTAAVAEELARYQNPPSAPEPEPTPEPVRDDMNETENEQGGAIVSTLVGEES